MTLRELFFGYYAIFFVFPIENFSVTLYRKKRRERVRLHAARARRVWVRALRAHTLIATTAAPRRAAHSRAQ